MKKNTNLISFDEELFKRRGVKPRPRKPPLTPERVKVDPKQDIVVGLAMDILSIVSPHSTSNPIQVIAALQVVGNTLGSEYLKTLGREAVSKIVTSAQILSGQYRPEYKDGREQEPTPEVQDEPMAGDQKDEPER